MKCRYCMENDLQEGAEVCPHCGKFQTEPPFLQGFLIPFLVAMTPIAICMGIIYLVFALK